MKQSWANDIEDFVTFFAFLVFLHTLTAHTILSGL